MNNIDLLGAIRDVLLPLVDSCNNPCGDMVSCSVSERKCVLHLAEQIAKQYKELQSSRTEYARECCIATQKACAENAKTIKTGNCGSYFDASVNKESITKTDNIVLL